MGESSHGAIDPARWQRVWELFDAVVEHQPADRDAHLARACAGDLDLRREVESLLAHDRAADDPVGAIVAVAAQGVIEVEVRETAAWPTPAGIGHYRILGKLGEGGMGEVFLAEDTILGRRVALKLPAAPLAGDPHACARLQREARAAATLNHPHVCIVHEVGEAPDGRPFIAMEYVQGETLAARIARSRLTLDEVLTLGREAAGALEEAHARGVVHRDLKPSNIILTPHGIKLLDFGLASLGRTDDAGTFMGTVRYMSPEQARGEALDPRTDLFSLGVVLYEAATGRMPFDGDLPAGLDRVIARALAKDREQRYQTATELASDLRHLATHSRRTSIAWAGSAVAVGIVAILAILGIMAAGPPARRAGLATVQTPDKKTVLVAGFSNTTGDAAFDGTLREALIVQLQQTPFLTLLPEAGVRETLRLMARPPDEALTSNIAREIVARRGIAAWITGSIASQDNHQDNHYVIILTASTGGGVVLARERVEAVGKAQVLGALDRAVVQLRRMLGESAPTIQTFSAPVDQATTGSLDALKAYALGAEQSRRGDYATAASLFQRAVQIDPDFALAHQALAIEEMNSSSSERVVSAATRAFELRTRVTPREEASIVTFYHRSVTGDVDQAIAAASRWQRMYPSEWRPYNALADLYWSIGAWTQAVDAAREAVRLNPDAATPYSNLAGALYGLGRFDEAREVYRQAMARGFDAPEYHVYLWRIAVLAGDREATRQQLDWIGSSSTWALNILAESSALQGRWREAQARTAKTAALFDARGVSGLATRALSYEMMHGALFGDCAVSRRAIPRVLTSQVQDEQAEAMLVMALCGDPDRALRVAEALRARRPLDTLINRVWLPSIQASAALTRGHPAQAIDLLRMTAPYDGTAESWPIYLRALALLRTGKGEAARAEFEKVLQHPGWTFWPPLGPLSHLGRARAAAMIGDVDTASRAYEDLFALWRDADADLPVLVAARREYAQLLR